MKVESNKLDPAASDHLRKPASLPPDSLRQSNHFHYSSARFPSGRLLHVTPRLLHEAILPVVRRRPDPVTASLGTAFLRAATPDGTRLGLARCAVVGWPSRAADWLGPCALVIRPPFFLSISVFLLFGLVSFLSSSSLLGLSFLLPVRCFHSIPVIGGI